MAVQGAAELANGNGLSNGNGTERTSRTTDLRGLTMAPIRNTKEVFFIRHGEGWHNIGYEDQEDAHLTPFGWAQAAAVKQHMVSQNLRVQLVVVSPLMRTLETAVGIFGGGPVTDPQQPVLMLAKGEEPKRRTAQPAMACAPGVPFIAHEGCRERMGVNPCDRHRPLSLTRELYPGVDFSLVKSDRDVDWERIHNAPLSGSIYDAGEDEYTVAERGVAFLKWLMTRPEERIAVVSHCGWLRHTLGTFGETLPDAAGISLTRDFNNCEMRVVVLTDTHSPPPAKDATWFPGGRDWQWQTPAAAAKTA
ncbi:hypothetical protein WJX72_007356 [[Myrmecia] bisecta]|uniref:Phosphoglycerate mutase n=1 Tax=[Myrmecia] bisecta TaxID=41462 RepID=A0AAW1PNR5_9CHLO